MRKILFILLFFIVAGSVKGQMTISAGNMNVCCGDTFYLPIIGSNISNISAIQLGINYDASHFSFDIVNYGASTNPYYSNFIIKNMGTNGFVNSIPNGPGQGIIAVAWFNTIPANIVNDTLFKIRLICICSPISPTQPLPFTFRLMTPTYFCELGDSNGNIISCLYVNGSVTQMPLPGVAGPITGPSPVCQNVTYTYSILPIANIVYQWVVPVGATIVSGQGTNSITIKYNNAVSGNISVYGSNGCGNSNTSTKAITVNPAPVPNYPTQSITSGGSATLVGTVTPGAPNTYSYNWAPIAKISSSPTIANPVTTILSSLQIYTCTVTNTATGCFTVFTDTVKVTGIPLGINSATVSALDYCLGGTITLTVVAQGGTGSYLYTWSSNSPNAPITNPTSANATSVPTAAGTYTFTISVTDANNLIATVSQALTPITIHPLPTVSITETDASGTNNDNTICPGGTATLTAVGAGTIGPYTYAWSNGLGTGAIVNVTPIVTTTYTVSVSDANGCDATVTKTITVNPAITVSITETDASGNINDFIICTAGSATLTANGAGGVAPLVYSWNNGLGVGFSKTVSPLVTTMYTVTVTDSKGCTNSISTTITVNPALTVAIAETDASGNADDNTICPGGSATMTASSSNGTGPYIFNWNNGLGGGTIHTVTPAATTTYTVTVTDAKGCTGTLSKTIIVNPPLTVTIAETDVSGLSNDNTICPGGTATITASSANGTAPYTFNWDNGLGTGTTFNVTPAATTTYSVTVTDAKGCTGSVSKTITVNPVLSVTITEVDASGTANDNIICQGGSATLTASGAGGTSPYSYAWSNGLGVLATATASPAATTTYTVTITDAKGCTGTITHVITVNPVLTVTIAETDNSGTNNDNILCAGGSATLTASSTNGTGPYNFNWSNGLGTGTIVSVTPLATTTYTVTVTDANGCTGSVTKTITVNPALTTSITEADISGTVNDHIICAVGSATLTATKVGGTNPVVYTWDNGLGTGTPKTVTPATTTTYTVTATDANGCTASFSTTITVSPALTAFIAELDNSGTANDNIICSGGTASLTASGTGGTAPLTYLWSGGLGTTASINVNPAVTTSYTVTITDVNGCSGLATLTINVNSNLSSSITETDNSGISNDKIVCLGSSANITTVPVGGTPPYGYTWNPNIGSSAGPNTVTPPGTTTYMVTVTDVNGCQSSSSVTITVGAIPVANCGSPVTINYGLNTTLSGSGSGGIGPYSYSWSPLISIQSGANTATPTTVGLLVPTTFSLVVTDNVTGCQSQPCSVLISINGDTLAAGPTVIPTTICIGSAAQVFANSSGGNPPSYAYSWSGNPGGFLSTLQDPIVSPTVTTVYTVTVTDGFNPAATGSVTLTVNPLATANASIDQAICQGGTAALTGVIGGGATNGTWSDAGAGGTFNPNATTLNASYSPPPAFNGTITLTLTSEDPAGPCSFVSDDMVLTVYPAISASITETDNSGVPNDNIICSGGNATLTASGSNGLLPYTYNWSAGLGAGATHIVNPVAITTYNVTATDSHSCSSTATATIIVNPVLTASIAETDNSGTVNDNIICPGGTAVLTSSGTGGMPPYNYAWSNGLGTVSVVNVMIANTTTLSVTVTDVNGCTGIVSITITVNAAFSSSITETDNSGIVNDNLVCQGNNADITAIPTGGTTPYTYIWSPNLGNNAGPHTVAPAVTTNYLVTITDSHGCQSLSSVTITVGAIPVANCGSPDTINYGWTTTLSGSGSGGIGPYSYSWTPLISIQSGANTATPTTVGLLVPTTFSLVVTDNATGCQSQPCSVLISINGGPLAVTPSATPSTICVGSTSLLEAHPSGGNPPTYAFSWTSNPVGFTSTMQDPPPVSPLVTTIYYVNIQDGPNTPFTSSDTVIVNQNPVVADQAQVICSDVACGVTLGASTSAVPIASYNITSIVNNGLTASSGGPAIGTGLPASVIADDAWTNTTNAVVNVVYTIVPISAAGCQGSQFFVTLTVNPEPVVADQNQTVCSNVISSVTLGASTSEPASTYDIISISAGGLTASAGSPVTGISLGNNEIFNDAWINFTSAPVSIVYTVIPNSILACYGDPFTVTITINPEPVVVSQVATLCSDIASGLTIGASSTVAATTYNITNIVSNGLLTSAGSPVISTGLTDNVIADDAWTNTTGAAVNVVYTLVPVSATGCEGNPFMITLTINPEPFVPVTNLTICSDAASGVLLGPSTSVAAVSYNIISIDSIGLTAYAGTPSIGTNLISTEIIDDAYTNNGSTTLSVIYTVIPVSADLCEGKTFTVTLNISPEPVIANQSATPCSDVPSAVTLNASTTVAATTYNITDINSNGLTASAGTPAIGSAFANTIISDDAWTNTGFLPVDVIYTVKPVSAFGCVGEPFTLTLTINPEPVVVNQTITICSDVASGLILNPSMSVAAATYNFISINSNGLTSSAGSPGTGTGYDNAVIADDAWTNTTNIPVSIIMNVSAVSADGCIGNPFLVTLVINPEPLGQVGTQTICSGTTLNYGLQPKILNGLVSTFSWVASDNPNVTGESTTTQTGNFITDNLVNNATTAQTINYTITPSGTVYNCTGNSFTITIIVNAISTANAGPDQTLCQGNPALLAGTIGGGAVTGTWSASQAGGSFAPNANALNATYTSPAAYSGPITLTLTSNDPDGAGPCVAVTDNMILNVNQVATINAGTVLPICQGSCITLNGVIGGGATSATWNDGGVGGTFTPSATTLTASYCPPVAYSGSVTLTLTTNDPDGPAGPCAALTSAINLTVYALPIANAGLDVTIPYGTSTTLNGSTTNCVNCSYSWTPVILLANATVLTPTTVNLYNPPPTFTLVVTNLTTGCTSLSDDVIITFANGPLSIPAHATPGAICMGDSSLLTLTPSGGSGIYTYSWSSLPAGGPYPANDSMYVHPSVPTKYYVTIDDGFNTATDSVIVFVYTRPVATAGSNTPVCQDSLLSLISGPNAMANYLWTGPNIFTSSLQNPSITNAGTAAAGLYQVIVKDGNGCIDTATTTVVVNPQSLVTNSNTAFQYCAGTTTPAIPLTGNLLGTTFTWTNDNTSIGLAASGNGPTIPSFLTTNAGTTILTAIISVTPFANNCPGPKQDFYISVYPTPIVGVIPDVALCVGSSTTAIVFTSSVPGTTYSWTNTEPLIGLVASSGGNATGIGSFVTTNAGLAPLTGTIHVTPVANTCTGPDEVYTITVNPLPVMTAAPNQTVCLNEPAFILTGATPLNGTYSGTGVSAGSFNPALAGVGPHTITYGYTNANNCFNSTTFIITVNSITAGTIGTNQTICSNNTPAAFTVTTPATGFGTLTYQWQNGTSAGGPWTNIAGATSATYAPPALTADTWYQRIVYSVVNNDTCTAISNVLTITINNVTAGVMGNDATICSGTVPPSLVVITPATGSGVLTYQWQSAIISTGPFSNIAGATNDTYSPPSLTADRCYRRIVTSTLNLVQCTATSNVVCITVNHVTASVIAANQTICNGSVPAPFTQNTAASGTGTLSYQWQYSIVSNTGPWIQIPGATATTYSPPALTVSTWYQIIVTCTLNGVPCSDVSNVRKITINNINPGTITADQTICSGSTPACFAVGIAATGTGALTYQWLSGPSALGGWTQITGATSATYCPPALTVDTWYCRIVYSTSGGVPCSDTTNVVRITINSVLAGTVAADQTICSGTIPACFSVTTAATGTGLLTYQWQSALIAAGPYGNIAGATSSTYCPPGTAVTTWYHMVVTSTLNNVACSATSNNIKITINSVTAGVIAANQTICNGSTPSPFTITTLATGSNLIYQWQIGTSAGGPWSNIVGATGATYAPPALTADTWYRRTVKSILNSDTCTANSNVIAITINNVTAGTIATDQTICSGSTPAAFTVTTAATGSGTLSYQWQNGPCPVGPFAQIPGATLSTYAPPALISNMGYRRITISTLNSTSCPVFTNVLCITINNVTAGTIAADQTICSGDDPVAFTVPVAATGSGTLTYEWQKALTAGGPWNLIPLATNATYDAPALTVDTWYKRIVTSTLNGVPCIATSNILKVTINTITPGTVATDQTICSGTSPAVFTVTTAATGAGVLTYQWYNGTSATTITNLIPGATGSTYSPPALTVDTWYHRIVTTTLNGRTCTDTSNVIHITINNVTAGVVAADQVICNGSSPAPFTVTTGSIGSGTLTYQWQSAPTAGGVWTNIPSATSDIYAPPALTVSKWYRRIVTSTLNNVSCTAISNVLSVTVNPLPISNPGIDTTICRNMSLSITWATASNYSTVSWTKTGDGSFNDPTNIHPVYTPGPADITNGSVILTLTANGILPCGNVSQSFTLFISDFTVAYAGPDTTICQGVPYVINTSSMSNATTVTWSTSGSGTFNNITILHPTYTPSLGDVLAESVDLSMHVVNSLLFCGDSTHTMTLTIVPLPIAEAGPNVQVCLGDSVQLQASGGTSFFWTPSAGLSAVNIPNPWATPMNTTEYHVLVSLNGCSKSDFVLVTVYPLPIANAGLDRTICRGDATELTVTGGYTYLWSTGATAQSIIVSPPVTTTYYATVTDYHGCTNVDDVIVTVNWPPTITITPPFDYICRDSTVRLQASGASTYTWFPTSGLSSPIGPVVWATPIQNTTYTVTGSDATGCTSTAEVSIRVYPTPVLILPDSGYVCDGVPLELNAGFNDSTSYQWQDGSTSQYFTVTDWGTYWVIATNKGCSVMDTTSIDICTKIWVPNAFTPDGNNTNDIFLAKTFRPLKKFHMYIFTRWGEVVFESDDIYKGWDGDYEGQPAPMGTYIYVITFIGQANNAMDKEGELKGSVNLIR